MSVNVNRDSWRFFPRIWSRLRGAPVTNKWQGLIQDFFLSGVRKKPGGVEAGERGGGGGGGEERKNK